MKYIISISFFLTIVFNCHSQNGVPNEVYLPDGSKHIEQKFKYPGGSDGLVKDIVANFKIPRQAKKDGLSGQIILEITVDTLGKMSSKILKGLRPDVDSAAVDMVRKLKTSEPATQDARKVEMKLRLPLTI